MATDALSKRELCFLEAIMDLLWQHADDGTYDNENGVAPIWDYGLSANESAMAILEKHGFCDRGNLLYNKLHALQEEAAK